MDSHLECRFEGKDWQGDEYTCRTHKGENPALCSHAAADLERRLKEAEVRAVPLPSEHYTNRILALESHLARLEEEKAQLQGDLRVEQRLHESTTKVIEAIETAVDGELPEHYTEDNATIVGEVYRMRKRLAQAEAREAAMRAAIEELRLVRADNYEDHPEEVIAWGMAEAALSPDAGRALAAEVETLREIERAIRRFIFDYPGYIAISKVVRGGLDDALAKQGDEASKNREAHLEPDEGE